MTTATTSVPILDTYRRWPVEFVSGRGARLFDRDGREYVDLVAGIAVASLGHSHPAVVDAISQQAAKLMHVSNLYETEPQQLLAQRLAELTGGKHVFFCNSGAEAIECAIKFARKRQVQRTGSPGRIVAANDAFHGRTLGALAVTGQPAKKISFEPLPGGFQHVGYGDAAALAAVLGPDVAAVVLEPILGEAGVVVPPAGYLARARELCDEAGALLVLDEVQTGVGRTGTFLAAEVEGVDPDVVCLAKGLASGLPIGACLVAEEHAGVFEPGDHGTTFGGGPVVCAAALAVLAAIEDEDLLARAVDAGARLAAGLTKIFTGCEVRGRGLLLGVDLGREAARAVCAAALERGVLVNDATPSALRFCPPLVIADADIDLALDVLAEVWEARP